MHCNKDLQTALNYVCSTTIQPTVQYYDDLCLYISHVSTYVSHMNNSTQTIIDVT